MSSEKHAAGQNKRVVNMAYDMYDDVLSKHFSKTYPNGFSGYRGAKYNKDKVFINPQKVKRVSKDTSNLYYVLMDNLPSYKNYPSRSKSLIFTNKISDASDYLTPSGKIYRVYPNNRSKIAIAISKNQFISLPHLYSELGLSAADKFDDFLYRFLTSIYSVRDCGSYWKQFDVIKLNKNDHEDEDMYNFLQRIKSKRYSFDAVNFHDENDTLQFFDQMSEYIKDNYNELRRLINYDVNVIKYGVWNGDKNLKFIDYLQNQNILNVLNKLLDPVKNDIKLMDVVGAYNYVKNSSNTYEMWTDGLCYLADASNEVNF